MSDSAQRLAKLQQRQRQMENMERELSPKKRQLSSEYEGKAVDGFNRERDEICVPQPIPPRQSNGLAWMER